MVKKITLLFTIFICLSFLGIFTQAKANGIEDEFAIDINYLTAPVQPVWQVLGAPVDVRATVMQSEDGWLTIVPEFFSQNAWFQDAYGPLLFQTVTGNFSAVTQLRVVSNTNNNVPPNVGFNAGGFVLRDPAGTHTNNENWVMYNMGGQGQNGVSYAREVKKTVNSTSNLFLTEQIGLQEYLLVCRVDSRFFFYYWADVINEWREERFYRSVDVDGTVTTTWRNSDSVTPEIPTPANGDSSRMFFDHDLMPETIQVGIMGHAWSNSNTQADFNFVRFAQQTPLSQDDCLTEFTQMGDDLIFANTFE